LRIDFKIIWALGILALLGFVLMGVRAFYPVDPGAASTQVPFEVKTGDGFRDVAKGLSQKHLIRSVTVFKLYALATGEATNFKPGKYSFDKGMGLTTIIRALATGVNPDLAVTIPPGASIYMADKILADAGILARGTLVLFAKTTSSSIEGRLFPDTYRFYPSSTPGEVVGKMTANFAAKAGPVLAKASDPQAALILASLLEKEVPGHPDREIVAGILLKRLEANMLLQVDATVCYVKYIKRGEYGPCQPITASDLALESPYNTYIHRGLPPGPIGSPGEDALGSVLNATSSRYWFYLSDPKTQKTVFSETLDEHTRNRIQYLGTNRF
jgi:UPF0755 protein